MITSITMLSLMLADSQPVARPPVVFSGHVSVLPLSSPMVGADLEVREATWTWALTAEGGAAINLVGDPLNGVKVWSVWGRWVPWRSGGHAWGLLAGYNQSNKLYPRPDMVVHGGNPLDPAGYLVGAYYEWSSPGFWVRVAPHIASDFSQNSWFAPTLRSGLVGPPIAEVGWRLSSHVDVALRLSLLPIRIGATF